MVPAGDPVDEQGPVATESFSPIHREPPPFVDQSVEVDILETGIKRADGAPDELMKNMGARVVEVSSENLRVLKHRLLELPDVISAAQLGARLRVLVKNRVSSPVAYLSGQPFIGTGDSLTEVRPSLEDVFVTSTGRGRQ